jgi:hypothetical protein
MFQALSLFLPRKQAPKLETTIHATCEEIWICSHHSPSKKVEETNEKFVPVPLCN